MIDVENFIYFIKELFGSSIIYFDRFKNDLIFFEIDCLDEVNNKLSIEVTSETIKVSSLSKLPTVDFSLHDYSFKSSLEAKDFLYEIKKSRIFYPHK